MGVYIDVQFFLLTDFFMKNQRPDDKLLFAKKNLYSIHQYNLKINVYVIFEGPYF